VANLLNAGVRLGKQWEPDAEPHPPYGKPQRALADTHHGEAEQKQVRSQSQRHAAADLDDLSVGLGGQEPHVEDGRRQADATTRTFMRATRRGARFFMVGPPARWVSMPCRVKKVSAVGSAHTMRTLFSCFPL
jgi:hypothetical protein